MRVQVVPLKEAMSINGLRAVFGEQYPDPVRVVAVGNKVSDMVAAPDKDDWLTGSVELCGGTHIKNTKEAHGFALVNEEASARPQTSSACVCLLLLLLYLGACCSALASRPRTCAALSCVSTGRVARAARRASRHDMRARAWATGDVTGASGGMAGGGQGHPTRDGRDVAARRPGACDGRCAVGAA